MKKYKIIKVTCKAAHYELKVRGLIFYHTVMESGCDIHGGYWEYPKQFRSIESVKEYIEDLPVNQVRKLIK